MRRGPLAAGEKVQFTDRRSNKITDQLVPGGVTQTSHGSILHDDVIGQTEGLIADNVSQRNIGAAGVLSGFAPHGLPVTQQHQAARGDCGSGIASQLSFSHVSTLADASCVFIPFRHVSRTYSGMFSDALHWFHE